MRIDCRIVEVMESNGLSREEAELAIDPRTDRPAWHLRDKLHDFDMIDARVATLTEYLTALVDDYHTALIAKGTSEPHADLHRARCLKVVVGCGFHHWADLHAGAVERWLSEQRTSGMTTNTSNHFVVAVKGFANWMVKDGRAR